MSVGFIKIQFKGLDIRFKSIQSYLESNLSEVAGQSKKSELLAKLQMTDTVINFNHFSM